MSAIVLPDLHHEVTQKQTTITTETSHVKIAVQSKLQNQAL